MLRNKLKTMSMSKSYFAYARQLSFKPMLNENYTLNTSLEEKLKALKQQHQEFPLHNKKVSIHRVPARLRKVEPEAYEPHFVSIGPYHHFSPNLQASEKLKVLSLNRLVGQGDKLHKMVDNLMDIEHVARECYSEEVELSKDEFVNMLLLDGCFIVELFRDLNRNDFASSSLFTKRWMLPVVRRDLITLENQLPMIVLEKIFDQTCVDSEKKMSLLELTLRFFDPLMPRENKEVLEQSIASLLASKRKFEHLLDVFHSSISLGDEVERKKEPHMYRSATELKKAGVKICTLTEALPLELKFMRGKLWIPSLVIDNHTGCFLRNILAYEQCHTDCKPDITTYLFFMDKLINSIEDVGLLHFQGVLQHTLGSNKQVAQLVNNLCLEIENDSQESYLYEVIERMNNYTSDNLVKVRTRLKHGYFTNIWVTISTLVAFLLLYLTLLQSSCDAIEALEKKGQVEKSWWVVLNKFFLNPLGYLSECICGSSSPEDPEPVLNDVEFPN